MVKELVTEEHNSTNVAVGICKSVETVHSKAKSWSIPQPGESHKSHNRNESLI